MSDGHTTTTHTTDLWRSAPRVVLQGVHPAHPRQLRFHDRQSEELLDGAEKMQRTEKERGLRGLDGHIVPRGVLEHVQDAREPEDVLVDLWRGDRE